jgi:O-antigen/teichoic acid export membrane protein
MSIKSQKSLLKNTVALSIPNWVNPFVSLLLVYVLSRRLGVEGVGQYALLSSYLSVFSAIASMGLGGLIVREIIRNPQQIHILTVNSLLFGLFSSLIAIIVMDITIGFLNYDREMLLALIIGSTYLMPASCSRFLESSFLAVEKSEFTALGQFFENLTKVALCTIFILLGYGIVAISAMTVLSKLIGLILLLIFYFKAVGVLSLEPKQNVLTMLLKQSPIFLGIAVFSSIYTNVDIILLSKLAGVSSVGIYSAASKISQLAVIVPVAFSMAILPTFSRDFVHGLDSLRDKTELSIHYVLIICFPLVGGIIVLAEKLISLIYGPEFGGSTIILQLMAPSLIPYSLILILAQTLIASNYQRIDLVINVVAAILATGLNYVLIPKFIEFGAVLASICTLLTFLSLQVLFITRNMFRLNLLRLSIKPFLASIGMVLVTYSLRETNLLINYLISTIFYFGLLIVLKGLYPEEMAAIESAAKRLIHLVKL